jgi:hypothetical protein
MSIHLGDSFDYVFILVCWVPFLFLLTWWSSSGHSFLDIFPKIALILELKKRSLIYFV